ncbi:MAG TPA: SRPBCC family protein [Solirubrobacteraceae bacterium]|nr:SRPBCC family protein [Solirubrobacteraceae bacterium]
MVETSTSIEIERPAGEVFAFVSEFPNNPRWQRGQRSCRWTSEPPLRVGSTYDQHARFLGRDMVNAFRVVELEPGRSVTFTSESGTFPLTITRTVEPLGAGRSRFTEHVRGEPGGFFRIAEPLLRPLVKATIKRDFPRLKALLEAPHSG